MVRKQKQKKTLTPLYQHFWSSKNGQNGRYGWKKCKQKTSKRMNICTRKTTAKRTRMFYFSCPETFLRRNFFLPKLFSFIIIIIIIIFVCCCCCFIHYNNNWTTTTTSSFALHTFDQKKKKKNILLFLDQFKSWKKM